MSHLAQVAFAVLEDPTATAALKNVACVTVLAALEQGVEVAPGSHMAVWHHLLASDGSAVHLHRHELLDGDVARDALRVLRDPDSGEAACDLALAVLKSDNVRAVTEDDLVILADRLMGEGKMRRLSWLVERVHEERGLEPAFLVALRDRLAGADDPTVRVGAVEFAGLTPRLDETFIIRALGDPAPPVRVAAADLLERVDVLDRPLALVIVRRQLDVERHRTVLAALHHAMAAMVRGGRRVRRWEPPAGGEN